MDRKKDIQTEKQINRKKDKTISKKDIQKNGQKEMYLSL